MSFIDSHVGFIITTMVGFGFKFSFLATSENNKRHKQHKASIYKPQSKSCNC